jgi:pimeloyl-ACP methyl ester carboxylesterase
VGPPLLLVHGTTSTRKRWRAIAEPLARHFTLYLMDRRGRGDSGDGPNYTMAQEFSDVAAVADTIGAPLDVVAHSFGAACSLEAAMRTPSIKRLVIYEPPIPTVGVSASSDESGADKLDELLAANRPAEVLIHFYRHIIGVPEARISRMIESPEWSERRSPYRSSLWSAQTARRDIRVPLNFCRTHFRTHAQCRFPTSNTTRLIPLLSCSCVKCYTSSHRMHARHEGGTSK